MGGWTRREKAESESVPQGATGRAAGEGRQRMGARTAAGYNMRVEGDLLSDRSCGDSLPLCRKPVEVGGHIGERESSGGMRPWSLKSKVMRLVVRWCADGVVCMPAGQR